MLNEFFLIFISVFIQNKIILTMEGLLTKLTNFGMDYKASDFKTEVHFLGQIVGASNLTEEDGIFCEVFFEAGEKWKCLSNNSTLQTQTSYANVFI